jgi:hypothetical protein
LKRIRISEVELQARIIELENKVEAQDLVVAEDEKQCTLYWEHSRLAQDRSPALQSTVEITKDLDRLSNDLAISQDRCTTLKSEKAKLKAELHFALFGEKKALAKKDKVSAERDEALSEKGAALVSSERDQALIEKSMALALKDEVMSERLSVVEQLEKLQTQVIRLSEQLSGVPWLRDSSWSVGFN